MVYEHPPPRYIHNIPSDIFSALGLGESVYFINTVSFCRGGCRSSSIVDTPYHFCYGACQCPLISPETRGWKLVSISHGLSGVSYVLSVFDTGYVLVY
ncbi:hypothetical protein M413DRAFT_129704 [Hebeloma cylindrosporum]|uniref:Uncharacterized protein n=1 Tax=Hebeloma cylindrosporum TaxID=76867 RepID=A0A0C2YML1_HEBCY|nr:hypothetical protein M413DRAFT_129704 [Hebeloma cylindrosporum h7]